MDVTGARDVLHQVDAVSLERIVDPSKHGRRFGLVVDRVEGGDQVLAFLLVEGGSVLGLEADVGGAVLPRLGASPGDGLLGEVVANEATGRELTSQEGQRLTAAASYVQDFDASPDARLGPAPAARRAPLGRIPPSGRCPRP